MKLLIKKYWDEEDCPKPGDIVYFRLRRIRNENNKTHIYCQQLRFFSIKDKNIKFVDNGVIGMIIGRDDYGKIICTIFDGDYGIYTTLDDIIDLNGQRWQQHESHFKFRLIKRR